MSGRHVCFARRIGDEFHCEPCGLVWDANDPDPPVCKSHDRRTKVARAAIAAADLKLPIGERRVPVELPEDVAAAMARAFNANASLDRAGQVRAMRAAYRVLLDSLG